MHEEICTRGKSLLWRTLSTPFGVPMKMPMRESSDYGIGRGGKTLAIVEAFVILSGGKVYGQKYTVDAQKAYDICGAFSWGRAT